MLWVAFAFMTGAAVLAVLWPLSRRRDGGASPSIDRTFYEAELASIARDLERGLILEADAQVARTEAARRLLAAAPEVAAAPAGRTGIRIAAIVALLAVPAISLGLYDRLGNPNYPDQPLASRKAAPAADMDVDIAIAKIREHLASNPDDVRGWQIVAPVYMKLGRASDGALAYRQILRLLGPNAERLTTYGEALIFAANGSVTAEARDILKMALKDDATYPQARFYLALGAEQDGDSKTAIEGYSGLIAEQPNAPWADMVRERISGLGGTAPVLGPTPGPNGASDVANLPAQERDATIRSMVERLANRLSSEGGPVESWAQLIRAYTVLHETDKAREALANGRAAFNGDPDSRSKLDVLARELGIGG